MPYPNTPFLSDPVQKMQQVQNTQVQDSPWANGMQQGQQQGYGGYLEELFKKIPKDVLLRLLQGDLDRTLNGAQFGRALNQGDQLLQEQRRFQSNDPNQWQQMPGSSGFGRHM